MDHLLEILKIIDGALKSDPKKVTSYSRLLAEKLEAEGDQDAARKVMRTLTGKARPMSLAGAVPAERIPVDGESRFGLADEELVEQDQVELYLAPEVEDTVEEFLRHVKAANQLLAHGVGVEASLLAYGPPGCGKTELARYIAARLELPLLTARTDSLISSYLGSTAKNLRQLFEHAMARPCVLLLDELDALAKLRDDKHELGELKRVVISLLQNIDALDGNTVVLGATNHEHLLDPAVWRRFAYRVRLDLPIESVREQILGRFLGEFADPAHVSVFARVSDDLSGADLKQIAEDSKRAAILNDQEAVDEGDLLRRILRAKGLLPPPGDPEALQGSLRKLREVYPGRVLSYRRLAAVFGISTGHVSNLLRAEE